LAEDIGTMFGFGRDDQQSDSFPRVSTRLCATVFNGKYPHVGLFDSSNRKIWVCKPLGGQAIRTSHARLITGGTDNATGTVWKDRFICFWFYTPRTGEGYIHGYPIDWDEAHLLVRIDPQWDYDRRRLIAPEMQDHVEANLERQFRVGERILEFYQQCKLSYPFSLHYLGQRATDSQFYVRRVEPQS
jgi:hypothetical protein